jgi:hypothetical protein
VPLAGDLKRLPKRLPGHLISLKTISTLRPDDSEVLHGVQVLVDGDIPNALVMPLPINSGAHPHAGLVLHLT